MILIYIPCLLAILGYSYWRLKFTLLTKKIFQYYLSVIMLQTDWRNSFLEEVADQTQQFFNSVFISITTLKSHHTGQILISLGIEKIWANSEIIEKKEFYLQRKKHSFLPWVYKTEEMCFQSNQINNFQKFVMNNSFMIPVYFLDKKNEELYISLYFSNKMIMMISYLKFFIFRNLITNVYAGLFRNFFQIFENYTGDFIDSIEDYVMVALDKDARIVSWNKGAEKLFGYRSIEIVGQNFGVLFNYDEEDTFEKALSVLKLKKNVKFFVTLKDRLYIPIKVELQITKLISITSELTGYSVFVKDITKEEIFKNNIQQHSFINYTILENTQDGILILDESDKIIFYNQRVRVILDNSMNLFGIPGRKIFPRKFGEEFEKMVDKLKESDQEFMDIDYCFENKYYNIRFFRVHKNSNKEYGGVIIFFIDESVRIMTMVELEEKKEALEIINNNLLDALMSARIMQENLIPNKQFSNERLSTESIYLLSDELGGDFYYYETITINSREYYIAFISDVSGHGISSSMMNVMVKDVYGTYIDDLKNGSPIECIYFLQSLNKKLLNLHISENKFITCIIMIVDLEGQEIKISSAGHTLPYVVREDKVSLLDFKRAIPLGVVDFINSDTYTLSYKAGDRIILYTDGFLDLFETNSQKPIKSALSYINTHKNKSLIDLKSLFTKKYLQHKKQQMGISDDMTILMIEFK